MWLSWYRIHLQCGRPGFDPWAGKTSWRRERLPTSVFWSGKFHGLSPCGRKESDTTERLSLHFFISVHLKIFMHKIRKILPISQCFFKFKIVLIFLNGVWLLYNAVSILLYNVNQLYVSIYLLPLQPASVHHPTPLKTTVRYHLTLSEWPSSKGL